MAIRRLYRRACGFATKHAKRSHDIAESQSRREIWRALAVSVQRVDHGDVSIDLDGLAVENCGAITPLADRSYSGLVEKWIARDDFQGLDGTVRGDDGVQ